MFTLHIANKNYSSWSLRPWVLMKELDIPFKESLSPFGEDSNWEAFRAFSPTGLVPALNTGELEIWDSLAIAEYLAEDYPAIWPSDRIARAWARSASAEMHSGFSALRNQCSMNCGLRVQLHSIDSALQKDLDRIDELWPQGLDKFGGPFLAGDKFTAVDAFYAPVVFRIRTFGLSLGGQAQQYVNKILALDSMRDWEQEALKETWREPGHERECIANGTLLNDFRVSSS